MYNSEAIQRPWVYRIYVKDPKTMKRFAPIGPKGTVVINLIYALHFTETEGPIALADLQSNNPELHFKLVKI